MENDTYSLKKYAFLLDLFGCLGALCYGAYWVMLLLDHVGKKFTPTMLTYAGKGLFGTLAIFLGLKVIKYLLFCFADLVDSISEKSSQK